MNNIYLNIGMLAYPKEPGSKSYQLDKCKRVVNVLGYSWEEVISKTRKAKIVDIRTCICKYLYEKRWTLKEIGSELDIHHANVIHHNKKFTNLLPYDDRIQMIWNTIKITL